MNDYIYLCVILINFLVMIDEAAIIPYTNNWKQTQANNTPQYIHTNKNDEFISRIDLSFKYHFK